MSFSESFCPYCNSLHSAFPNQNYCSNTGDTIHSVKSNAYYFKSNKLNSGQHVSRFSIRSISFGYQSYNIGNRDYVIDNRSYLTIPEGEHFQSELETNNPVEGIIAAFHQDDLNDVFRELTTTHGDLLDNPDKDLSLEVPNRLFVSSQRERMTSLFRQIVSGIESNISDNLYYQEIFNSLLESYFLDLKDIYKSIRQIKALKRSTRIEIYERVLKAKLYIDAHLDQNLSLENLAKESTMSKFHFQRSFNSIFKQTPHQYLQARRIQKSKFLLKDSDLPINKISTAVGYQDQGSFGRLFKRHIGISPLEYRLK